MKPDDVLRAVAETGGVVGMSATPHTTLSPGTPRHSIKSVMDTSTTAPTWSASTTSRSARTRCYGDHVALHRIFAHLLGISATPGPSFDPVAYVDGLENPTENFANICGWLVQHGYDDADIRAVLGGNIYRTAVHLGVTPPRRRARTVAPSIGLAYRAGSPSPGVGAAAAPVGLG